MPWYREGTVAVTAGQTTVTGTGTNFSLNARVGDAFQGPDGRWYEVANIASAAVMGILPAYQGATVASGVYGLAPMQGYVKEAADRLRQIVNQFGGTLALLGNPADVAALRTNIGAASRGANSDITSLVGLTTALSIAQGGTGATTQADARAALGAAGRGANGDISSLNGLTTALSVEQGGTGGKTQADARAGLGLGSVSVENVVPVDKGGTGGATAEDARAALGLATVASKVDPAIGRLMTTGYAGIGCSSGNNAPTLSNMSGLSLSGVFSFSSPANNPGFAFGTTLISRHTDGSFGSLAMSITDSRLAYRSYNTSSGFSTWASIWTTANTTVDASGFIKRASPIARIADVAASGRADLLDGFEADGNWGVFNDKARGVSITRLEIGRYRIAGALGLARSGWQVGSPTDRNGGGKLGIAAGIVDQDGSVIIELRKVRYRLTEEGELEPVAGALMDVPAESWIDVRLDMPGIPADD